jgi:hypothetical protein
MKMLGQAHEEFVKAEMAYRREQLINDMQRMPRAHRSGRVRWVQALIDAVKTGRDPVRGASRYELDGPILRPAGAPHHLTSH